MSLGEKCLVEGYSAKIADSQQRIDNQGSAQSLIQVQHAFGLAERYHCATQRSQPPNPKEMTVRFFSRKVPNLFSTDPPKSHTPKILRQKPAEN